MTKLLQLSIVIIIVNKTGSYELPDHKGDDREEYTISAARERDRKLRGLFGEELWNVALKLVRRSVCMDTDGSKRTRFILVNG